MDVTRAGGRTGIASIGRTSRTKLICLGLAVISLCLSLTLVRAGTAAAAGERTTYTAAESVPVPPASNFAGSGGGDGWAVALSDTQVFNVFHHNPTLQVVCHNQTDASVCFGPDTITDSLGNNFATEGHPGMYYDSNTGKLYVYATRTSDTTPGVVCVDTTQPSSNPDPFCGFTALAPAGQAGSGMLSTPMLYGNRWYAFNYFSGASVGAENQMLCFDVSTDAPCSGQPYAVDFGVGTVSSGSFPSPSTALIGSQLIIPIVVNSKQELACLDAATNQSCSGAWPVSLSFSYASVNGAPFPMLDGNGNLTGLCLPTGTDQCFDLSGASVATPTGMTSVIGGSDGWNGPGLVLGPRVYVPNGNVGSSGEVECYDYSTSASCPQFPKSFNNLGYLYTVNADPQRPTCIWVNADDGSAQIQNFDAYTGGACGQGPVRALASQFVNSGSACTPSSYNSLRIVTPAPSQYQGGSVQFEDGDGNPIPGASDRPIDSNGFVDLTGLNLNTATGLPQFLITLNGAQATSIDLKLSWNAPYEPACASDSDGDTQASNPAIVGSSGTPLGATEGQSFSGAVASFSDPDATARPGDYAASINWGDGSTSAATITGTRSKFTVTGSHTYAEEGSYHVTTTIVDNDGSGNNATVGDTVAVADAGLHATGVAPLLSGNKASGTVATFSDSDSKGALSDYTASINWGDGVTSTGAVGSSSGHFTISGSHTYAKTGSYKITVMIKDAGGATAMATVPSARVAAARVNRGSAHLAAAACVAGAFTVRVSGAQISSVTVKLDGRSQHTRVIHRGRRYTARISIPAGRHALTVHVKFKRASKTRARTFRRVLAHCAAAPTFTG